MRVPRLIDPTQDIDRHVTETLGARSQRAIVDAIAHNERLNQRTGNTLITETITWYRENIPGVALTAYGMRVGTPTSASAWASTTLPLIMPEQASVLAARLYLSEVRTGGGIVLRLRVNSTDYDLTPITIDASTGTLLTAQQATAVFPVRNAIVIEQGATVECRVYVTSTFAPTTADATAVVTFGYDSP